MIISSEKLQDVQLGSPIIEDGVFHAFMHIKYLDETRKETESEDNLHFINIRHEILEPTTKREDGSPVSEKLKVSIFKSIPVRNPNYKYEQDIARIAKAFGIDYLEEDVNLDDFDGKLIKCVVGYEPPKGNYSEKNVIKGWSKADESFEAPQF